MAVVLAETGVGKSRLVQALYQELATDAHWDPPDVDYWPHAFDRPGVQLRVNPDMSDHAPLGPPRFLWLGMRWQPTDVRNVEERVCALPAARSALQTHVAIASKHQSFWVQARQKAAHAVRVHGKEELVGAIADQTGIPLAGLIVKMARAGQQMAGGDKTAPRTFDAAEARATASFAEEFLGELRVLFGGFGSGGVATPLVLWLDDAHWIDVLSLHFLNLVWAEATTRKWPLFLIATHWEREWRESKPGTDTGDERSFRALAARADATEVLLSPATDAALIAVLRERLPGLTRAQESLLLDKADGNFLSMVENIGELLRKPQAFVGRNLAGAFSSGGEQLVRTWESERARRIEQRFSNLEPEIQDLLGWGSAIGVRFLRDVVADYASRVVEMAGADALIESCVDPFVILGKPIDSLREFKDRAFHRAAKRHFDQFCGEQADALAQTLREHLVAWVNWQFDGEGKVLLVEPNSQVSDVGFGAPPVDRLEAREILDLAVRVLKHDVQPDWREPEQAAALRARVCAVFNDAGQQMWERVRLDAGALIETDWCSVPCGVLSDVARDVLCDHLRTAGAMNALHGLESAGLTPLRVDVDATGTTESRRRLSVALTFLGDTKRTLGDIDGAAECFGESLAIARSIAAGDPSELNRRRLGDSLYGLGALEMNRGALDIAEDLLLQSRVIAQALVDENCTDVSLRRLMVALGPLSELAKERGDFRQALAHADDALAVAREIDSVVPTPQSHRDVGVQLNNRGMLHAECGDLQAARADFTESLRIAREHGEALGPYGTGAVLTVLRHLADVDIKSGDVVGATGRYTEALESAQDLSLALGTPAAQREVAIILIELSAISWQKADFANSRLRAHEALDLLESVCSRTGTPSSIRDVGTALERLGFAEVGANDLVAALQHFSAAVERERHAAAVLGTPAGSLRIASGLTEVAAVLELQGNWEGARRELTEAVILARRADALLGTPVSQRGVGFALARLGHVETARGEFDQASALLIESTEIARALAARLDTPDSWRNLDETLTQSGRLHAAAGNWPAAREAYAESVGVEARIVAVCQTPAGQLRAAQGHLSLGDVMLQLGEVDAAAAQFAAAVELARELVLSYASGCELCSDALKRLAIAEAARSDMDAAERCLLDALAWDEAFAARADTIASKSALADVLFELGGLAASRADPATAIARYTKSLEIIRFIHATAGSLETLHAAALLTELVGLLELEHGQSSAARVYLTESANLVGQLHAALGTPESAQALADSLHQLATLAEAADA